MTILKRLLSCFAWRDVKQLGVWLYRENKITGKRMALRVVSGGYSPLDVKWLYSGTGLPTVTDDISWISKR